MSLLGSQAQFLRAILRGLQDAQESSHARDWAGENRRLRNEVASMQQLQVDWQHHVGGEMSEFCSAKVEQLGVRQGYCNMKVYRMYELREDRIKPCRNGTRCS